MRQYTPLSSPCDCALLGPCHCCFPPGGKCIMQTSNREQEHFSPAAPLSACSVVPHTPPHNPPQQTGKIEAIIIRRDSLFFSLSLLPLPLPRAMLKDIHHTHTHTHKSLALHHTHIPNKQCSIICLPHTPFFSLSPLGMLDTPPSLPFLERTTYHPLRFIRLHSEKP
jgi:hypothetical protein